MSVVAMGLVACMPLVAQEPGPDWPQWRGPDRNGTVESFTHPPSWPEQLTRRWQIDVGEGHTTPVLVGDQVYMFTREGADEVMRSLDAATGNEVWRTSYPAPFSVDPATEPHGPGPKATPAFSAGRLYTLGLGEW